LAELRLRTIDEAEIETILGEDVTFSGIIRIEHPALIKGQITGDIHSASDLYIHKSARIDAKIEAQMLSIKGDVKGTVKVSKRIEIFQSGILEAQIITPDLLIQSGSIFNGNCKMDKHAKTEPHTPSPQEISNDSL